MAKERTPLAALILTGSVAIVLSGCAGPSRSPQSARGSTSTASSTTSTPVEERPSASTTITTTSAATSGSRRCTNSDIGVADSGGGGALGHEDQVLVFTNESASGCALSGYPGVAALNASGQQVLQAQRSVSGYMGGLTSGSTIPVVTLGPNQAASAIVEGTDNPVGTATSCPYYPYLLVTPPSLTKSVRVTVTGLGSSPSGFPGCSGIHVHPVVSGTSGSSPGL